MFDSYLPAARQTLLIFQLLLPYLVLINVLINHPSKVPLLHLIPVPQTPLKIL